MGGREESARRLSGCVTSLLTEQPFFGSLALRLALRPDPTRETLASDGRELRYSPGVGGGARTRTASGPRWRGWCSRARSSTTRAGGGGTRSVGSGPRSA